MERKHNNPSLTNLAEQSNQTVLETKVQEPEIIIHKLEEYEAKVLFIEPFYGGSHKQLIDFLLKHISHVFISLSAKKWPWRARCGALIISQMVPPLTNEKILFCSSVLSLAELVGLRPDLNSLRKVVYFHENQFIYPIRKIKERDIQFAYNQITTCLAADLIIFNSEFNKNTLLENINKIIKLFPDYRPKNLLDKIKPKCKVLYFPVAFPKNLKFNRNDTCLHIVWPHRWEFDKDPELFLQILMELKKSGACFKVHILGEVFQDVPDIFDVAKVELQNEILTCNYVEDKNKYYEILNSCHVAVSTAKHEFFGVSMLEAAYFGCFPLVPNTLVYPEIYPKECLYNNKIDCLKKLDRYCKNPNFAIEERKKLNLDFNKYSEENLLPFYLEIFK